MAVILDDFEPGSGTNDIGNTSWTLPWTYPGGMTCPVCSARARQIEDHCPRKCGWWRCRSCGATGDGRKHTHSARKKDECRTCTKPPR